MNVKLDGITLHVGIDEMPPHPRKDCDNLGTLLGWHKNYDFSDKDDYPTSKDFYESEEAKNIYVCLPVYLLDHSGLYLSVTDFHDEWDSCLLGDMKEYVEPQYQPLFDKLAAQSEKSAYM